jgi:hypothetical protein
MIVFLAGKIRALREPQGGVGVMEEIQCEEVRKKLPDYRERLLKHPEKGQIERHLYYCPECIFQLALVTARSLEKIPTPL